MPNYTAAASNPAIARGDPANFVGGKLLTAAGEGFFEIGLGKGNWRENDARDNKST